MNRWRVLLVLGLALVCGPAWAKDKGKGHGGKPTAERTLPEGARPPGLARQDKMPKGLEKKGKTLEGWSRGKKKGWLERTFGGGDGDASEPFESQKPEKHPKPKKPQ